LKTRLSKDEILDRFRTCCQKLGEVPGGMVFCKIARLKQSDILYYWPRFSELVKECGEMPQGWQIKIPEAKLFEDYARVCLHLKKIPTINELRIQTRLLKTCTQHTTLSERFGSIGEFDNKFRNWLKEQSSDLHKILNFSGWKRPIAPTKSRGSQQVDSSTYSFYPYLPACLQTLNIMSRGEIPQNAEKDLSVQTLFERRCSDAFRCLGFEITGLGQGKGRSADCVAIATRERFALIIDAKSRAEGYVLGTEDRKFLEYAINHGKDLQSKGIDRIYLIVISSSFQDSDLEKLRTYLTNSPIRSVTLLTANATMRIVEDSIRERHSFTLSYLEKIFFSDKIISE